MQLESVLLVHIRLSTLVQSMRNQYLHLTSQKYLSLDKIPGEKKNKLLVSLLISTEWKTMDLCSEKYVFYSFPYLCAHEYYKEMNISA